ncbi:hypothetical protein BG015_002045 [Linnemannia schmuckeri]|uniref:SH3 domain-containing protein n=1 Tax=Linnemannia schmuckeri TaxID=64567 RepID=A0A9P5V6M7_9FUNG|nr:hypothetical protein BG015_002045 [Linnemannia schmuckeri]
MQRNPTKPEPAPKYGVAKTFGSTPSTPLPTTTAASSPAVARSWNAPVVNTPPPVSAVKPVERTWKSSGASSYSGTVPGVTFNKIAPPSSLLNYGNSNTTTNSSSNSHVSSTIPATRNDPTMNKAQQMRLEREAREKEERERIKREIEASEARDRQAQGQSNAFKEAEEKRLQEEQRQREQREQEERQRSQDRAREEREAREKEERARADAEDAARLAREEIKAREQAAQEEDQKRQKEQQQRQREKEEKEAAEKRAKQQREEEEKKAEEEERRRQEEEERERAAQAAAAAVPATAQVATPSQVSHAGHEAAPDSVSAVVLYSYEQAEENEMSLIEGEVVVNVTELDVGWWSGESADGTRSGLFPANYVEVIENTQDHAATAPAAAHYEEEDHAAHYVDAPASNGHAHAEAAATAAASTGPSAVALYDYAAGEPNELSFAEGDVITDIEFVTDDWWNGTSNGASGLFPSNYVEIYIFEYAINHLQRSDSNIDSNSNGNTRAVLIVTDSRVTLQESLRRERQVCKDLYSFSTSFGSSHHFQDGDRSGMNPWDHLWPPPRPPPPDEYSTETPPSSPTITPSIPLVEHQQRSKESTSSFRPDLWARIQIRYAPTIRHIMSLFRCLHLNPGSTQGKTFGGGDIPEFVVPSSPIATTTAEGGRSVTQPTLVILLGCFGHDHSLETRRFSMLDIVPAFAGLRAFDETEYLVEKSEKGDESMSRVSHRSGAGRSSGAGVRVGGLEDVVEAFEGGGDGGGKQKEGEEELDAKESEEIEYTEYIRTVANTMAEIKDSLAWLERSSGRKPQLLIVEDTGQGHSDSSQLQGSSRSTTTRQQQLQQQQQETMMMPTVRELWLQTAMGFWVDAFVKIELWLSPAIQQQQQQQERKRESYRLWVRTQDSLSAAFTTAATTALQSTWAEEGSPFGASAGAPTAASMGAVLGVQWRFDSMGERIHFEIVP